jgi:AcrR family transcriptional regulator
MVVATRATRRPSKRPAKGTPRPRHLSREAIVQAALRVVDTEGVDAVTMRRIADELDTGAASLYAHVADKDELLGAVYDTAMGAVEISDIKPTARGWQQQLKEFIRRYRSALLEHRDLAKVQLGNVPTGENAARAMEKMLAILDAAKLPARVIGYAPDLLAQFMTASAYEHYLWQQRASSPEEMQQFHDELQSYFESLPAEEFPTLRRLAADLVQEDEAEDARFEFGLDILVKGLAAHTRR